MLEEFISNQPLHGRKKLESALKFWDERKFRLAFPFRQSIYNIPRSSLAHMSMKAAGRKNLSLVDAAYVDIESSSFFEGKWQRREEGEKSFRSGPTGIDLFEREEIRQMARANQYVTRPRKEIESGDESDFSVSSLESGIYDPNKSRRPDNLLQSRQLYHNEREGH